MYGLDKLQAYFTPQDNVQQILIDYIASEKKSIYCAMYMFTDQKIANALVDAFARGIDVQVVLDQVSMSKVGKGKFLQIHNIPVVVHTCDSCSPFSMSLMHHKFFIFGCNKDDQPLLWTGSWNCTVGGTKRNYENVLLLWDTQIIDVYISMFSSLQSTVAAEA
jgi:phosphatidylserine/phosphatidylglycerophosphate/cardiolipin synthase-like enzyme